MRIIVSPAAAVDIERLRDFLADKSPAAARRAVAVLARAIESLDVFPDRGRPCGIQDMRDLIVPFGRSAYVLRYIHATGADEVVIVRIWHGREQRE